MCTLCQVNPFPIGLCREGNRTCLKNVLPWIRPKNSLQFFFLPKSYGFLKARPCACLSLTLTWASTLVSPLDIFWPCITDNVPNANKTDTQVTAINITALRFKGSAAIRCDSVIAGTGKSCSRGKFIKSYSTILTGTKTPLWFNRTGCPMRSGSIFAVRPPAIKIYNLNKYPSITIKRLNYLLFLRF